MKKTLMIIFAILTSLGFAYAQATATDFTTNDCNGTSHNLFDELAKIKLERSLYNN